MATSPQIEKVKTALRISTQAYDEELADLVQAALLDLGVAGVVVPEIDQQQGTLDPLVMKAVITYCKMSFGLPEDYDRLKRSYDEQKAQMSTHTGYTNWEVARNV